jgi:hypothetical protein
MAEKAVPKLTEIVAKQTIIKGKLSMAWSDDLGGWFVMGETPMWTGFCGEK